MNYTNSPLATYTKLSPNHSGQRNHDIIYFTPHCVVGQTSIERIGDIFAPKARQASCNYGIGKDGRIGLICEEKNRSWCTSSSWNDNRAITIECASDSSHPYAMNSAVYESLVKLCVDVCQRYGKKKVIWFNNKTTTMNYTVKADELVITVHRWFAAKACPGDWLYNRLGDFAKEVNKRLTGSTIEPTPSTQPTPSASSTTALFKVQTGAFLKKTNADNMIEKLKKDGFEAFIVKSGLYYKIQLGAFANKSNAESLAKKLKDKGYETVIVTSNTQPDAKKTIDGYVVGNTYKVVAKKGLNVRTYASTSAQRLTTLAYGSKVTATDLSKVGNDVWMNTSSGWVCAKQGSNVYVK